MTADKLEMSKKRVGRGKGISKTLSLWARKIMLLLAEMGKLGKDRI